tara:strand:+ start:1000 stop:1881 length:882 start_codon:yes stop_codon:yes gene_type:complete
MGHATFRAGEITAIIGDNAADEATGSHRAGYNGVWDFRHKSSTRSIFVPRYAGLNLEHIFNGETEFGGNDIFFEPRRAPMTFKKLNDSQCELHQPATPNLQVESTTRFTVRAPWYLDMEFQCKPHQHVHRRGWFGCFWASYINGPEDKSLYFPGGWRPNESLWMQLCTQEHDDESTVLAHGDEFQLTWKKGSRDALFKNYSRMRFARPFYYGNFEGLAYILMFKPAAGIRLTHSPSGGGVNAKFNTTNPAWDWQFIVPKYEVMEEYGYKARAVLRPRCSRKEILEEYEKWVKE